eukprot:2623089-Rhodomonas_salina.1
MPSSVPSTTRPPMPRPIRRQAAGCRTGRCPRDRVRMMRISCVLESRRSSRRRMKCKESRGSAVVCRGAGVRCARCMGGLAISSSTAKNA